MTGLLSILGFGFLLGLRHAADADHVVAVSTLVAKSKSLRTAWVLAAAWGIGHSATIFLVGVLIILFKVSVPKTVSLSFEFLVGVMLLLLGLLNLAGRNIGAWTVDVHSHEHDHKDPAHSHGHEKAPEHNPHSHTHFHVSEADTGWIQGPVKEAGPKILARALTVGLVHGLAGSAAVVLLVLAAIPTPAAAVLYLLLFALGTLAGMIALSYLLAASMRQLSKKWRSFERLLVSGTGLASILMGLTILRSTIVEGGLFR